MSLASYMHIKALCNQKRLTDAFNIISHALQQGLQLESDCVAEVLKLCTSMRAIAEGRQLHSLIRDKAVRPNRYLQNNLLNMYLKCGDLAEGQQVFDEMRTRDVVSWNVMIAGYAKSGNTSKAIKLFWRMQHEEMQPNKNTCVCVLIACAPPACAEEGVNIHGLIVAWGLELNAYVGNALVGMYYKFKRLLDARYVFEVMPVKDVVMWTSMITGYSECGYGDEALYLFQQMLQEGVVPDKVIFLSALHACASAGTLRCGLKLHLLIINTAVDLNPFIGSALVNMYAKCGNLHLARKVFEQLAMKDMVAWTVLMSGYEQQGKSSEALGVFNEMLNVGVNPGEVTFISAVNACAVLAAFDLGIVVHSCVVESGYESNVYVASALVDMYAKCGSEKDIYGVFGALLNCDAVVWNAMIDGMAQHGNSEGALQYFEQMKQDGVELDSMTFATVLAACNHAGLVDEGLCYFDSMQRDYGMRPTFELYACIVDMLSRAGHLEAANTFVQRHSSDSTMSLLTPLLSACRIHGNVDVAESVVESMIKLQPQRESTYVLLSSVYASTKRQKNKL